MDQFFKIFRLILQKITKSGHAGVGDDEIQPMESGCGTDHQPIYDVDISGITGHSDAFPTIFTKSIVQFLHRGTQQCRVEIIEDQTTTVGSELTRNFFPDSLTSSRDDGGFVSEF